MSHLPWRITYGCRLGTIYYMRHEFKTLACALAPRNNPRSITESRYIADDNTKTSSVHNTDHSGLKITGKNLKALQNPSERYKSIRDSDTSNEKHVHSNLTPDFFSDVPNQSAFSKNNNEFERNQSRHAYRPKVNPNETSLLLFPGQGSQFVGMGKVLLDYPNVRKLYERASEILKYDLLGICLNGPKEKLDMTVHCQPAVVVSSLAALEKLKEQHPWAIENCISAAGYSVGEYSALVFSGVLSFDDAIHVVKKRAEAMQKASELVSSRMMTVFMNSDAKVNFACHAARLYCTQELNMEHVVCEVTNYLFPGCKIISGNAEALQFIELNAGEFGIKRAQYLPVSGAFHSKLMLPAKTALQKVIKSVTLNAPIVPVYSNVNSYKYQSTSIIERLLVEQIYKPVMWEQTMHVLCSRPQGEPFPHIFEVGPGRQLGAILSKINKKAFEQYKSISA